MTDWRVLGEELAAWRDAGATATLWWRDDDAAGPSAPLAELLALSRRSAVPLALAVIPEAAHAEAIGDAQFVLLHGCDHRNRAAPGEKKTEFPAGEPDAEALERLARARERLARLAGERFIPALAPPWNRLRESLVARLAEAGISGLSRYGARARAGAGVREVNTHADIIAWRGSRGFVGEEGALGLIVQHLAARRSGRADAAEPSGILTHHAQHDAAAWRFLERLFDETRAAGAAWLSARQLFPPVP
jgi:peptidoglycan/xylan/chitin deacetylase (PgdA/CDA1 family)